MMFKSRMMQVLLAGTAIAVSGIAYADGPSTPWLPVGATLA